MSKINFVLSDHYENWVNLNPLTLTKPISSLRVGITTIHEKWTQALQAPVLVKTCVPQLKRLDTWLAQQGESYLFINSNVIPNKELTAALQKLEEGESLYHNQELVASKITLGKESFEKELQYTSPLLRIAFPWDIFSNNQAILQQDFETICADRKSLPLSATNLVIGDKNLIFLEEGAKVEGAILNTSNGPIYLGENAEIMEGSMVRGGLALCANASLKLGTKIYGATTVGPHSKVGGEINNSVIQGYSNKGHDGFLGNSVIGEWCNLGADTNNSNLKNNYGKVNVFNYNKKDYIDSGLQFLGLIMGDHSKCGINTMFNTGTVVGVFANIFGGNFPPKHISSFSWGGSEGFSVYDLNKAFEVASRVMERRGIELSENDKDVLTYIHQTETK